LYGHTALDRLGRDQALVGTNGADVGATRKWVVAPVAETYPMREGIEVMNPLAAVRALAEM
jgi:hypothetical protein